MLNKNETNLLRSLPLFVGESYRADYGYHLGYFTVFDILTYERDVLGSKNTIYADKQVLELLKKFTKKSVCWVTQSYELAMQYGKAEYWPVGEDARIIAEDGEGGFLVMYGDIVPK